MPRPAHQLASFEDTNAPQGGCLVSIDGRTLPLTHAHLDVDARGGVARVTLSQTFRNPHAEALRVTYSLPLPADGAVSGFRFRLADEVIVGEVDTKKQARQRFENAILEGRTAALLDQERSSLFTQEVGNIPPRSEVVCEVQVDQRLAWLADGAWEWRFPTVVAPRYLGASGRVPDAAQVSVEVAQEPLPIEMGLSLAIRDHLSERVRPESPSHALHSSRALGRTEVTFADERGARLDRDVVVRWVVAAEHPTSNLDCYEKNGRVFGLLTLVPPSADAPMPAVSRDLIVLLDTSGSMQGAPLDQARRLTQALVDSLDDRDQLELIEFSSTARRWKRGAVAATASNRRDAQGWLTRLRASGGTEMRTGILEALAPLRPDSQRQIVLVTDGLIGFESEIVSTIAHQLPRGSRVHTIGVGSGVNRSLTQPAARAGRGVEHVLGLTEDVEVAVKRLLARTCAPLITNVEISGTAVRAVAPARVNDLFARAPTLISLELDPRGGTLVISGDTAGSRHEETLYVPAAPRPSGNQAIAALFARECVEDLELSLAAGGTRSEIDSSIERTGLEFQISTRLTSWVAISSRSTVDPRAPRRVENMPHMLAEGLSAEGVGLRPALRSMPFGAGAANQGLAKDALVMSERAASRPTTGSFAMLKKGLGAAPDAPRAEEARTSLAYDSPSSDDEGDELPAPGAPPPPAPAPASAPRSLAKPGLFERAKRLLTPSKSSAPSHAARVRRIRGVLVSATQRSTAFTFTVTALRLSWAPPTEVEVVTADGTSRWVKVVLEYTTVPGAYDVGLQLTLVIEGEWANASRLRVPSTDETLEIEF